MDTNNSPPQAERTTNGGGPERNRSPSRAGEICADQLASRRDNRFLIVLLLLGFAYGGYHAGSRIKLLLARRVCRRASLPRLKRPRSSCKQTPAGTVPMTLRPPNGPPSAPQPTTPLAAPIPRLDKLIGSIRKPASRATAFLRNALLCGNRMLCERSRSRRHQCTKRRPKSAASLQHIKREQEAIQAPTSIRNSTNAILFDVGATTHRRTLFLQVEALSHALGARQGGDSAASRKWTSFRERL